MSTQALTIIFIWILLLILILLISYKTLYWHRQPKTTAVITAKEMRVTHENHHKVDYWYVTYQFDEPDGRTGLLGSGRWYGKDAPVIGQQITINYNPKNDKSLIEGTYSLEGMKILIVGLIIFGLFASAMISSGVNISRRRW